MQPGSIVGLVKSLTDKDIEILMGKGLPIIDGESTYLVTDGPRYQTWKVGSNRRVVSAIKLAEVGDEWLDSYYFAELQAPGEVSIENLISEPEICTV